MSEFSRSVMLLFVLLNPFLMSVYLLDLVERLTLGVFARVLARASVISFVAFSLFAIFGDAIFKDVLQVRFAAFLIFGGILFMIIGLRFVFEGSGTHQILRGAPEHLGGSVAMPFMIGPGTVSASVLAGSRLPVVEACSAILVALVASGVSLVLFKLLLDRLRRRSEQLFERYVDIMGRMAALVVGSVAVDMILQGIETFVRRLSLSI